MALGEEESEQRRRFKESLRRTDVSIEELWLRYFSLGGQAGQFEVEAYIHGAMSLPALQRDLLAHALNERLDETYSPEPRAPYSEVLAEPPPAEGADRAGDDAQDGARDGARDHGQDDAQDDAGAGEDPDEDGPDPDG